MIATVAWRYWRLQRRARGKRPPTQDQWDRAHAKTGAAIYNLATKMGGAFVKLGQVLGSRGDVLPEALVKPLRGLHDRVPARPLAKLQRHIERELAIAAGPNRDAGAKRRPLDEVFLEIEPTALAAASLAQVHAAKLRDGTRVAVKVQYPEARRLFPIDLSSLRRAVRVARWLNRSLDLRPLVDELAHFVTLELQFSREATSTARVRANLEGDATVVVPRVYTEFSTDKLLVLEFIEGTALTKIDTLKAAGVDVAQVAKQLAELYARMIFEHGFFHGDPHPGNVLVLSGGRLGLLDFGLAKELPAGFAGNAAKMIAAGMSGNTPGALEAARAIGFVVTDAKAPHLISLIKALLGDYEKAGDMLKQLAPGELEIPSHFTLIARVMVILSGVSHALVPNQRIIGGALFAALAKAQAQARATG